MKSKASKSLTLLLAVFAIPGYQSVVDFQSTTNTISIYSNKGLVLKTNLVGEMQFTPTYKTIYRIEVLTNDVSFATNWYRLDAEFQDGLVDTYAWTADTNGVPFWTFAHIGTRAYRTNKVKPPQNLRLMEIKE